ncbi:hypothetical protein LDG_5033 [Legionella drancourtii LLAP12]|uniref:Uncharacterized protein n=1 Tax=Legionella drancourtii LLAP12 TaxID=658187 RepID=G9EIM7_9GAMM|nr:hypothetical protein LDG_5033 [Legionella drancourtii LLAP12]
MKSMTFYAVWVKLHIRGKSELQPLNSIKFKQIDVNQKNYLTINRVDFYLLNLEKVLLYKASIIYSPHKN